MPIEILMPALSPTMTEGNLAKWLKKEGDKVAPGEVIAEIETDKATMEVESIYEGVIGKILVKEGTASVAVNHCIALLLEEGESKEVLKEYQPKTVVVEKASADEGKASDEAAGEVKESAAKGSALVAVDAASLGITPPPVLDLTLEESQVVASVNREIKASPLAKRLAKEHGLALENISGTGPRGRIVEADVEDAICSGGLGGGKVVRTASSYKAVTNDNMRKIIASRLLQSKQHVPHFYLNIDCELEALLAMRADLNDEGKSRLIDGKPAYKLSVNDLVIKAASKALKEHPQVNASWSEEAVVYYNNVDVAVAVAIDGGLVTPIIRNADQKSLAILSNEMKSLAARAKAGKLAPEEFQGGGFSISNLGMYGIKHFNAIINPPQACILAVGAGEKRPVVKGDTIVPATVMSVTLSCDHRVVDGAVGALFLNSFKRYIEKPVTLLV